MIDKNKRYRYRNGKEIIGMIFDVPSKYRGSIIVTVSHDGDICQHSLDGDAFAMPYSEDRDEWDLVEKAKYDDLNRGDVVIVWNSEKEPVNAFVRVFSRVSDLGKPAVFYNKDTDDFFENCRKATEEDFK